MRWLALGVQMLRVSARMSALDMGIVSRALVFATLGGPTSTAVSGSVQVCAAVMVIAIMVLAIAMLDGEGLIAP